jgi:hypothetical protein
MGEKRWTERAARAQEATSDAAMRVRGFASRSATRAAARARGVGGAIGGVAATVPELIASIEGPEVPLREAWSVGLGQVLSGHPKLPDILHGVALNLDRLGHLQISPDAISFDGEAVPWEEINEIKFGPALDVVTSHALQNEVGRLTARLPQLPGRDWLVRQAIEVLVALCLAAAGAAHEEDPAGRSVDAVGDGVPSGVPVMITYGGPVRHKELTPGVFVALIAASIPSVSRAILSLAHARGIKVTVAPPSRSRKQAIVMRKIAGSLSGRLGRGGERRAIESGAGPEPAVLDPAVANETDIAPLADQSNPPGRMLTPGGEETEDSEFGGVLPTGRPSNASQIHRLPQPVARPAGTPDET